MPKEARTLCRQQLQSAIVLEHFWARGRTRMVDSRSASEKSAGCEHRLHGLLSMCLPIPAVQDFEEFEQLSNGVIVE